jgi:hypothetical protein
MQGDELMFNMNSDMESEQSKTCWDIVGPMIVRQLVYGRQAKGVKKVWDN